MREPPRYLEGRSATGVVDRAWGLLMVLLEDLRSVRAHTDMRTQTHTTLQISTLVAAGALVGGIFALEEQLSDRDFSDLFLIAPVPFFIIGAQYLEVSYQVYIAESYINRKLRPAVFEVLGRLPVAGQNAPDDQAEIPSEALMFEWFAEHSRSSSTSKTLARFKALFSVLTPVAVFLAIFCFQNPDPLTWRWWEGFLVAFWTAAFLGFAALARSVHGRRSLPELTERPPSEPEPAANASDDVDAVVEDTRS